MSGNSHVPRLALITDVPVERTLHGSLLLYRLLADYPVDRLLVVQSTRHRSAQPAAWLPGVEYRSYTYRISRLFRNRFNPVWPLIAASRERLKRRRLESCISDFQPEAILTVVHDFLWLVATDIARRHQLPLHLIVHDDWPSTTCGDQNGYCERVARYACRRLFGPAYRTAHSRLCVSPGMVEEYERLYGVSGTILYPSRGDDSPSAVVRTRRHRHGPPVVAFAGSLGNRGAVELLREVSCVLGELGGHLDLYTRTPADQIHELGLKQPVVRVMGFFPPVDMAESMADSAHILFLPGSFRSEEKIAVTTLFPSKLADYTAVGLPILIWGPAYSSAARWGLENPLAAITITMPNRSLIREAIVRAQAPQADDLAAAAVATGNRYFDLAIARTTFHKAICR